MVRGFDFEIDLSGKRKPTRSRTNKKYPWPEMLPGNSFFVTADGHDLNYLQSKIASIACGWVSRFASRKGIRFVTEKHPEGDTPGIRVWRIS
jgi:hypothetical protein